MTRKYWQDWTTAVLGAWLFLSPWIFPLRLPGGAVSASGELWNLWICGALVLTLALSARKTFVVWKEWTNTALGIWLFVSAWFWDGEISVALVWNTMICALLIVAFAGWCVGDAHELLPKRILNKGDMREGLPEGGLPHEEAYIVGPDIVAPNLHVQAPGDVVKG
jgi:hypothetical protein